MSAFTKLKAEFSVNWTTILVGWNGLGVLSPWPDRWIEFPPLLTVDEIASFADERLASSLDSREQGFVVSLLSFDLRAESRGAIRDILEFLSGLEGCDPTIELRKWRLVLLWRVLEEIPTDPLYGVIALTEFWQSVGFPSDSPYEIQGRESTTTPAEYYQQQNWDRLLAHHRAWIEQERAAIRKQEAEEEKK